MKIETIAGYVWDHSRDEHKKLLLASMSLSLEFSDLLWRELDRRTRVALYVEMRGRLSERERNNKEPDIFSMEAAA